MLNISEDRCKIKVLFVLPSLNVGGAEKVTLNIIRRLDREKFDIELLALNGEGEYLNLIPGDIKFFDLKKNRARYALFGLVKVIKNEKPGIIFSSSGQMIILLYLIKKVFKLKFIMVSRSSTFQSEVKTNKLLKSLLRLAFGASDYVVATTKEMEKDFINNYNIKKSMIRVIYNPVNLENIERIKKEPVEANYFSEHPVILGCGRLVKEKGFRYLIKAFSIITEKYQKAKLLILGEGPQKEKLAILAKNLGLRDKVIFLGFQKNPFKYMANADVFVLSSLREGLPNCLLEAMACGVPVVSTNCQSGPSEILQYGRYGILVPVGNSMALANGVLKLLNNPDLRAKYSESALKRVREFDSKKIIRLYEEFFLEIVKSAKEAE